MLLTIYDIPAIHNSCYAIVYPIMNDVTPTYLSMTSSTDAGVLGERERRSDTTESVVHTSTGEELRAQTSAVG